tara:strand:- start:439 stop:684 length:246 start_codon:yes stop_codon:yes gene_type:complete
LIVEIPVVASFTRLDNLITAPSRLAVVGTGIVRNTIAIVTGFPAVPNQAIATTGISATIGAGILIDTIAIVARFKARLTGL